MDLLYPVFYVQCCSPNILVHDHPWSCDATQISWTRTLFTLSEASVVSTASFPSCWQNLNACLWSPQSALLSGIRNTRQLNNFIPYKGRAWAGSSPPAPMLMYVFVSWNVLKLPRSYFCQNIKTIVQHTFNISQFVFTHFTLNYLQSQADYFSITFLSFRVQYSNPVSSEQY
jgi:hypothetical protein